MLAIWDKLSKLGMDTDINTRSAKRIMLVNRVAMIFGLVVFSYGFIFLFVGYPVQAVALESTFLLMITAMILNRYKKYLPARLLVIAAINFVVFYFTKCMGLRGGSQMVLFYCAVLPWLFFREEERIYAAGSTLLSMGLYFYLVFVPYTPLLVMTSALLDFFYVSSTAVSFSMLAITIALYYNESNRIESFLGNTNKILQDTKTKLQQTLLENDTVIAFSQVMYSHGNNIDDLCNAGLAKLRDMMHCTYAAVLLYDKKDDSLHLRAEIGFNSSHRRNLVIRNGETLAGSAFSNQKTMRVQDTPTAYWHMATATGSGKPAELVILPMTFKTQAGVLEMAFMEPCSDADIATLQRLAVTFAANLLVLMTGEENAALVGTLQQQNAELEQLRVQTTERTRQQYEAQQTLIKQIVDKGKQKEQEYQARIDALQQQLKAS